MKKSKPVPVYSITDFSLPAGLTGLNSAAAYFEIARIEDVLTLKNSGEEIPFPHRHNFYEVLWMTHGDDVHTIDFEIFPIAPHTLFFLSPGQIHAWQREDIQGYAMFFTAEFFALGMSGQSPPRHLSLFPFFHSVGTKPMLNATLSDAATFTDLLQKIETEYTAKAAGWEDVVRAYLQVLLTLAARLYRASPNAVRPQSASEATARLIRKFKMQIESDFLRTQSVSDYAKKLFITPAHLNAAAKTMLGKTAGDLIRERLVLEAKRLLRHSEMNISEIAMSLGFDDPAYFARFFKKHTASTPQQFRTAPLKN